MLKAPLIWGTWNGSWATSLTRDVCPEALSEDFALVSIELGTKTFMRAVKSRRITFVGQLATFGNKKVEFVNFK